MIVCPSCRNANPEDAATCERCGSSLDPEVTVQLSRRPSSQRPPIEVARPKQPSPWLAVAVLGVLLGAGIGLGAWYVLRPSPCDGTNFTSDRFGYCLTVPEHWEWRPARFGDTVTIDQFSPPSQSATVLIEAADLPDGATLETFADSVRQKDQGAGLTPGAMESATVDGVSALAWNVDYTSTSGAHYGMREVVVVNDHFGWRMMLNDTADDFRARVPQFDRMVSSFRFR